MMKKYFSFKFSFSGRTELVLLDSPFSSESDATKISYNYPAHRHVGAQNVTKSYKPCWTQSHAQIVKYLVQVTTLKAGTDHCCSGGEGLVSRADRVVELIIVFGVSRATWMERI